MVAPAAERHVATRERIKKLNEKSLMIGVPGLMLQAAGGTIVGGVTGLTVLAVGTVLLVVGLGYYARSRGQHPALGLFGLLSLVGLVVLALLPRRCVVCGGSSKKGHCVSCGAPVAE